MSQYTLPVNNNAAHTDYVMVFQKDPGAWAPNAMSLAWLSKKSNPGSLVTFDWTIDWGFSWSNAGELIPGVKYRSSQDYTIANGHNQVTLDYNGAFQFQDFTKGTDPDHLYMLENESIPVGSTGSVGVTMSGSTVYATQARPNTNLTFSPHPTYYLSYGDYEAGTVLDVSTVNNPLEVRFDTGVYDLEVTLQADNSWSAPKPVS